MTHCSECYRKFLGLRRTLKIGRNRRAFFVEWTLAAAVVGVVMLLTIKSWPGQSDRKRPQNAELAYTKGTIDIPSVQRSEAARVACQLANWEQAGRYDFRLLKAEEAIVSTPVRTRVSVTTASFLAQVDLSKISEGSCPFMRRSFLKRP